MLKLADIQETVNEKYAPLELELADRTIAMRVPLRLSRKERKAIMKAFDGADGQADRDALDMYQDVFRIVIEDKDDVKALFEALDDDLAVYQEIFSAFAERMQVGEAGSSES